MRSPFIWLGRYAKNLADGLIFSTDVDAPTDHVEGRMYYDNQEKTLNYQRYIVGVVNNIGEELQFPAVNKTGVDLVNGQPVYINGSQGGRPTIEPARSDNFTKAVRMIGLVTQATVTTNHEGYITTFGVVRDLALPTSTYADGDELWLAATGGFTKVKPSVTSGNQIVRIGYVRTAHNTQGEILVCPAVYPMYFGDVEGGNYSKFEDDGTLVAIGNAAVWDDVYPSSVTVGAGASIPSFTNFNGNLKAYEFLGTGVTTKDLQVGYQLPHGRKDGSYIVPHVHLYVPNNAASGVVKMGLEYTWVDIHGVSPSAVTIYGTLSVSANAGNLGNQILSFGEVTGNFGISSIVQTRLFRNPADAEDTFGASVWLMSADIHIYKDTIGSRLELSK